MNETHDPELRSWVESANDERSDFPIQNLPFGVFRRSGDTAPPRVGVAIGDRILDVAGCARAGLLDGDAAEAGAACDAPALNDLMALGRPAWSALREQLGRLLREGTPEGRRLATAPSLLVPQAEAEMFLPARIGDYTDFYASIHHATSVGRLFRPDNPLLPNYSWIPIGYHGRASSVVVSGAPVRRPSGQTKAPDAASPSFGPSRRLDYEIEIGVFVGPGNELGSPVPLKRAEDHLFGVCLVNDWSARDLQAWEYQPLGPFLAKSFATTVSPWVVTMEALEPFRVPLAGRGPEHPEPLPYLLDPRDRERGGVDLTVEVWLCSRRMREAGFEPVRLSRANAADLHWTFAQMLTHHASNGCNLQPGDLFASGTVSSPGGDGGGCLLEISRGGAESLTLPSGEERKFLEDGDEVILRGYCDRPGARRIGLGECRGEVVG
jgi:fumarylacetoacetase